MRKKFSRQPLFYVVCCIVAVFVCLVIYSLFSGDNHPHKTKNEPSAQIKTRNSTLKEREVYTEHRPTIKRKKEITKKVEKKPASAHRSAMEEAAREFETQAVENTLATHVRVESKSLDAPGYVAFMCGPECFKEGIPTVARQIAEMYFEAFPDAPRVTVSLIIGGAVRRKMTFFNDPYNGVISGKEKRRLEEQNQ